MGIFIILGCVTRLSKPARSGIAKSRRRETDLVYVLFVYAVIAVSLSIGNMIITLFETENETNVLYVAFFRQIETYWELDDDLNAVGIIIVLFLESLFIFPNSS